MKEIKFKYPEEWIKAIDRLIQTYKLIGNRYGGRCPLCEVESLEDPNGHFTFCVCPWTAFREEACCHIASDLKPASNIKRLQGWRKRFEAML